MADNYSFSQGSGSTAAGDDIGGVVYPRVKIVMGADGAADMDLDSGQQTGANSLPVVIASDQTVAVSGSVTVTGGTSVMAGDVAHDAVDSGKPIKIGTKVKGSLSGVTLASLDDRSDAYSDQDGALLIRENSTLDDVVSGNASVNDGSSTQVLAAGASGVKHYLTDVIITNTSATNMYVELKDGSTVKATFPAPANAGVVKTFRTPLEGTAATAWNFDPSTAGTTIFCSVSGFKSKI